MSATRGILGRAAWHAAWQHRCSRPGCWPASCRRSARPAPATFGTPTADSTFGTGIAFSQPVTVSAAIGRVEMLLTFADAIGPDGHRGPEPAGGGIDDPDLHPRHVGRRPPDPEHRRSSRAGGCSRPTAVRRSRSARSSTWSTPTTGSTGRRRRGELVRVHWYEGDAAFGAKALKLGEDEVRETSELLGVTETEPVDFFVYADVDEFYDALGPGAHENVAGSAFAEHPDAARAHPARPDRRPAGRGPDPARVRPPRLRHGLEEPVSQPAALAQRGPGGLPERGLRLVRSRRRSRTRPRLGHADPARRADRPVPQRQRLLPRLRGERRRGRLHDPDLRQRRPRLAGPLVRRRPDRRRGVQRRARARHDGLQRGLVQERQRHAEAEVRTAAGARRSGPVGLDGSCARWHGRVGRTGRPGGAGRDGLVGPGPGTGRPGERRRHAGLAGPRRWSRSAIGIVGVGRCVVDRRAAPRAATRHDRDASDPGDPELAGHPRRRAPRARLPHRRPARLGGPARPVHDPGADAAGRDGQ